MFKNSCKTCKTNKPNRLRFLIFNIIIIFFMFLCAKLAVWQVHRLYWKEALIATVSKRVNEPPVGAPGDDLWPKLNQDNSAYLPVKITGRFVNKPLYVTTMHQGQMGFWQMMPLQTNNNDIVFINRGFVPMDLKNKPSLRPVNSEQSISLVGLLRESEVSHSLFYRNNPAKNLWYERNTTQMAQALQLSDKKIAPFFIDQVKLADQYNYPLGGLTKVHFRNAHLSYILTWGTLALGLLGALIYINWQDCQQGAEDSKRKNKE